MASHVVIVLKLLLVLVSLEIPEPNDTAGFNNSIRTALIP
jgi:hypothetical protein